MKANVALPSIGQVFDASQVSVDRIAVGYWLGLADSVLGLGALGDRYGRTLRLLPGTALAIPMSLLVVGSSRGHCREARLGAPEPVGRRQGSRLQYPEAGAGMSPVGADTYKEAVP